MKLRRHPVLDEPEPRRRYLESLRSYGLHQLAASAAGVRVTTAQAYRQAHPEFELECQEALGLIGRRLMSKAREYALEGVVESEKYDPQTGALVERKYRHSEKVFLEWLRRVVPEMRQDHRGFEVEEARETSSVSLDQVSPEITRQIRDMLDSVTGLPTEP